VAQSHEIVTAARAAEYGIEGIAALFTEYR
jgi:hypothetical protein